MQCWESDEFFSSRAVSSNQTSGPVVVSLGSCVPTDWLDWLLTIHGELRVSMAEGGRGGRRAEPPYKPGFVVVGSGVTTVTGTPPPPSSNTNNSSKIFLILILKKYFTSHIASVTGTDYDEPEICPPAPVWDAAAAAAAQWNIPSLSFSRLLGSRQTCHKHKNSSSLCSDHSQGLWNLDVRGIVLYHIHNLVIIINIREKY